MKNQPGGEGSRTSGDSITSESSSAGFKPVPKKRTFLLRNTSSLSESNCQELDAQAGSASFVAAPRESVQGGLSVNSSQDKIPQNCAESHQESQSVQPSKAPDESFQQLHDGWQLSSNSRLDSEGKPTPLTGKRCVGNSSNYFQPKVLVNLCRSSNATHNPFNFRSFTNTRSDVSTERTISQQSNECYEEPQRELNTDILHSGSIQNSDRENNAGTATSHGEPSLPQSTVGEFDLVISASAIKLLTVDANIINHDAKVLDSGINVDVIKP